MVMRTVLFQQAGRWTALSSAARKPVAVAPTRLCFSTTTAVHQQPQQLQLRDSYEFVQVDRRADVGVGVIVLHRPQALNALCDGLFADLLHAATALDQDDAIGCLVLTGSIKAFAAGADIAEMKDRTFAHAYKTVRVYFFCR